MMRTVTRDMSNKTSWESSLTQFASFMLQSISGTSLWQLNRTSINRWQLFWKVYAIIEWEFRISHLRFCPVLCLTLVSWILYLYARYHFFLCMPIDPKNFADEPKATWCNWSPLPLDCPCNRVLHAPADLSTSTNWSIWDGRIAQVGNGTEYCEWNMEETRSSPAFRQIISILQILCCGNRAWWSMGAVRQ